MAEEKTSGVKTLFEDAVVPVSSGAPPGSATTGGEPGFPGRTGGKLQEIVRTTGGGLPSKG